MWTGVVLGVLGSISSESWPTIWLIIEVNLISFIPLITEKWRIKKMSILYFIVQRVGSLSLLCGGIFSERSLYIGLWIRFGLLLKSRLAPFHFWGAAVVTKLENLKSFIFLTWQKIAPIMLLILQPKWIGIIFLNILVGSMRSTGSKNMMVLLFFSGLIHMCWVIAAPHALACQYFLLYIRISAPLFFRNIRPILVLNVAGLPPLTGFFMKLSVLVLLRFSLALFFLLFSAIVLYSYMRLFLSSPSRSSPKPWITIPCGLGILYCTKSFKHSTFNWNSISIAPCFQQEF